MIHDSVLGRVVLVLGTAAFAYATAWLLVLPFVEAGQPLLHLFPPKEYVLLLAHSIGVAIAVLVLGYTGWALLTE